VGPQDRPGSAGETSSVPDHVVAGWLASGDSPWREPRDRWRRAADLAQTGYAAWRSAPWWERRAAFATYRAALGREQREAERYAEAWYAAIEA
jgi:hypothetical protein